MARHQIHAEYTGLNGESAPFTLEASLDELGRINRNGLIGWYQEGGKQHAIHSIEPNGTMIFSDNEIWSSNLLSKAAFVGQTFSVGTNLSGKLGQDYWVYKIVSIKPID